MSSRVPETSLPEAENLEVPGNEGPITSATPGEDVFGSPNNRIAISAITKINRKDFGLTWNVALEIGSISSATR